MACASAEGAQPDLAPPHSWPWLTARPKPRFPLGRLHVQHMLEAAFGTVTDVHSSGRDKR